MYNQVLEAPIASLIGHGIARRPQRLISSNANAILIYYQNRWKVPYSTTTTRHVQSTISGYRLAQPAI
jgi:hypothetical protein